MEALLVVLVIGLVAAVVLIRRRRYHQGVDTPRPLGPQPELFQPVRHPRPPRQQPPRHQAREDLMSQTGRRIGESICFVTGMAAENCTCAAHRPTHKR
jgi:hypothetical protein